MRTIDEGYARWRDRFRRTAKAKGFEFEPNRIAVLAFEAGWLECQVAVSEALDELLENEFGEGASMKINAHMWETDA